jgi:hypothetical protein
LPALNLKAEQALNFITIDSKNYGVSNFDFSGSSTSNLNITYTSSELLPKSPMENQIIGVGTGSIIASQSGMTII